MKTLQLHVVALLSLVDVLIHVYLSQRYVVVEVNDLVLVDEVVHLLVHSFD